MINRTPEENNRKERASCDRTDFGWKMNEYPKNLHLKRRFQGNTISLINTPKFTGKQPNNTELQHSRTKNI